MPRANILKLISPSLVLLILPLVSVTVFAQGETTSAIVGQVSDASGGAVPNATVTVTDESRGVSRTLVSDSTGQYAAPGLTPGTYTVTVTGTSPGVASEAAHSAQVTLVVN
jgi:protocatechuate 3,4-dioxygenase beta subunit